MTCKFEEKQPRRENKWNDHHTVWTRTFQSDNFFFHFLKPHSWIYNYMYWQFQGSDSLYRPMVGKLVMITVGILWAKRNNNFCNLYPISCPIISIFINDIMQVGRRTNAQGSKWVGVFSANYLFPLQGCLIFYIRKSTHFTPSITKHIAIWFLNQYNWKCMA